MFQLIPSEWCAMEVFDAIGASSNPHCSPIFVRSVKPLKTGKGLLEVAFFHVNYPEGVQEKQYTLRVLHRTSVHLAGARTDIKQESLIVFFCLDKQWIDIHFPTLDCPDGVEAALNRAFNGIRRE